MYIPDGQPDGMPYGNLYGRPFSTYTKEAPVGSFWLVQDPSGLLVLKVWVVRNHDWLAVRHRRASKRRLLEFWRHVIGTVRIKSLHKLQVLLRLDRRCDRDNLSHTGWRLLNWNLSHCHILLWIEFGTLRRRLRVEGLLGQYILIRRHRCCRGRLVRLLRSGLLRRRSSQSRLMRAVLVLGQRCFAAETTKNALAINRSSCTTQIRG